MTTVESTSATTVLGAARDLLPELRRRAAEVEAARRVPPDLLGELVGAGCFRILLPASHGGAEASLGEALEVYETLARGDGSTGWTVMIGATGWCEMAALPRGTFDALFPPSDDVIVAGAFAPSGSISPLDGGYELTGRWKFGSGGEHATLFFANAIEGFVDGHPAMRAAVLFPHEVTIEDTWHVAGLRGTGSHDFNVSGAVVPRDRTFVPLVDPRAIDATIVRIPTPTIFALGIAAVAIGTARGALDDVLELSEQKVPLLAAGALSASPLFQHGLARADAHLGAARALVADVARELWDRARAGEEISLADVARARAAATWATDAAVHTAEFAYRSGGGSALFDASPLQRRLRDVHATTQHFLVRPDSLVHAGEVLTGQALSTPVF